MSLVFLGYNEMGYRGLKLLLRRGVSVPAVFTYEDDPDENCWFGSVAELAGEAGIPTFTTEKINEPESVERIREIAPDVVLSIYYRHIVGKTLRGIPRHGAFNLHGSLLPLYRGRCPVNWQLVNGEAVSGVTLHHMVAKADAGDIVDQESVEVGPDDTALELVHKLVGAAEAVLERRIDELLAGTAPRTPQDHANATVFGGRTREDGRIDWTRSAREIHNLVRAVAPPWPGTFCEAPAGTLDIWRSRVREFPAEAGALVPGEVWIDPQGATTVAAGDGLVELVDFSPPEGAVLRSGDHLGGAN